MDKPLTGLYIPHGSDNTLQQGQVKELARLFISHMVQIIQLVALSLDTPTTTFISHMVQIILP